MPISAAPCLRLSIGSDPGAILRLSAESSAWLLWSSEAPGSASGKAVADSTTTTDHPNLIATTYAYGKGGQTIGALAYVQVGNAKKITCPTGHTCRIEADVNVQVNGNLLDRSGVSVCAQVDGAFMEIPGCPVLGGVAPLAYATFNFVYAQEGPEPAPTP